MTFRMLGLVGVTGLVSLAFGLTGCSLSETANPLSPDVAGPIPGVTISAPQLVQPLSGAKIADDAQPLTLTVGNATTSGFAAPNYLFEIATDTSFQQQGLFPGRDRAR